MKKLSELIDGQRAIIVNIHSNSEHARRLGEMGFIKGREIMAIKNAPLRDPIEYELMGYSVLLRRSEASQIDVVLYDSLSQRELEKLTLGSFTQTKSEDIGVRPQRREKEINVALIGNPNCGKTTLFNYVSGLDQHVGNYSGVTVDIKSATIKHQGYKINITDLPGTYSLSSYSPEEKIVKRELSSDKYDFIINVVDATLLERNLYLTTQMMDMARHIIVALNMYDQLERSGDKFDHSQLAQMLDIPFIPTSARTGMGVDAVLDTIVEHFEQQPPHIHVESNLGGFIEDRATKIVEALGDSDLEPGLPRRQVALSLMAGDKELLSNVDFAVLKVSVDARADVEKEYSSNIEQVLTDARYGYIAGALKETLRINSNRAKRSRSIDSILTSRVWGFPIFFALIWFMFYVTFTVGAYPMEWIESGVGVLSDWLRSVMAEGSLKDLLIEGVIGGVGGVIIFLPNILILFLFISILEDSGYMSRAAFIMDKLMHKIGLHGKSFVPMIMGFGCNVPAVMASRIIEDNKNRLLTILIVPFMSCSARLPVYILLIGAFFPSYPSLILFGVYMFGILLAILTSLLFKKLLFKGADHPFVMELPPYRMPLVRNTLKHMWNKGGQYLKKMGGVILIGSVIIWALGTYPTTQDSYLKKIGHTIEPVIEPLGFDWKVGVSLVSGIAAKEVVVGTMGVLYNIEDVESEQGDMEMVDKLRSDTHPNGEKIFTTPVALGFLAFVLIYFPCLAVLAAIKRECGGWRWALFSLGYTTVLAWVVSFLIVTIGRLL